MLIRTCLTLCTLITFSAICGQIVPFPTKYVYGSVSDDSTGQGIPYVHIYNESKRRAFITDGEGRFSIPASPGDTIVLTGLGYLAKVLVISNETAVTFLPVKMLPYVYPIPEVKVMAFKDYHDFRKKFLALKLDEDPVIRLREDLMALSHEQGNDAARRRQQQERAGATQEELVTYSVPLNLRSPEEKHMLNYLEVLKKESRKRVIEKKYNRQIIYSVTQLSEDEITDFMGFCNFSEEYLYQATPYDIVMRIEEKFREYKLRKENGSGNMEEDIWQRA